MNIIHLTRYTKNWALHQFSVFFSFLAFWELKFMRIFNEKENADDFKIEISITYLSASMSYNSLYLNFLPRKKTWK